MPSPETHDTLPRLLPQQETGRNPPPTWPPLAVTGGRRVLLVQAVSAVSLFLLSHLSLVLLPSSSGTGLVWPPAGLACALALLGGRRLWPAIATGSLAFHLSVGTGMGTAVVVASIELLQAALPALLLEWIGFRYWLESRRDLILFVGAQIFGSGFGAFLIPGLVYALGGHQGLRDLPVQRNPLEWWMGDATGALVVGGTLVLIASRLGRRKNRLSHLSTSHTTFYVALSVLLAAPAFFQPPTAAPGASLVLALLALPLGILVALALRPVETALFASLVSVLAATQTAHGFGPFAGSDTWASPAWAWMVALFGGSVLTSVRLREERRAHAHSRTSRLLLRRIVDTVPAVINVKDARGRVVFINQSQRELLDKDASEILGRMPSELDHSFLGSRLEALDREILSTGALRPFEEVRLENAEGQDRIFIQTKVPMKSSGSRYDSLLTVALDVSEQKRAERALRESEARLRSLLENLPGWVVLIDLEGRLLFGSHTSGGIALDDVIGVRHSISIPPAASARARMVREQVAATGQAAEYEIRVAEPREAWLSVAVSPVIEADQVVSLLLLLTDVTEGKRAGLARDMERDERASLQRFESLGALAGGVAHDFNNLLVGILGNAALLSEHLGTQPEGLDMVRQIQLAAERASEMCEQMLAYAGRKTIRAYPLDLNEILVELIGLLRGRIGDEVQIDLDLQPDLPAVLGDRAQLHRVAMNLVVNAADSIFDERGRVGVRSSVIDLASVGPTAPDLDAGVYVALEVTDEGCGMDEETLRHLFEPFFSTKRSGRGLGLAAVQGIVRSHGGAIDVTSAVGEGTTFRVLLPIAAAGAETDRTHLEDHGSADSPRGMGRTVLIVDDEELVLALARRVLEREGFRPLTARNSTELWQAFDVEGDTISLVLLDLTMPKTNPEENLARLHASWPEVPVILSSGYDADRARRLASQHHVAFLQKPYHPDRLAALARRTARLAPAPLGD